MKYLYFLLIFILSINTFAQQYQDSLRVVHGSVTYLELPLAAVVITIENSTLKTVTDDLGEYKILAKTGDKIKFSYTGLTELEILVEDVTSLLNVRMYPIRNELEEVVVNAKKRDIFDLTISEKLSHKFQTSRGPFSANSIPARVQYVSGKDLPLSYLNLADALKARFTRSLPNNWDIDGQLFNNQTPFIDINLVQDVFIINSNVGTLRWGGPVVIVRTINAVEYKTAQLNVNLEKLRNQSFYKNDAISKEFILQQENQSINKLTEFDDKFKSLDYYNSNLENNISDYATHIEISKLFYNYFKDEKIAKDILNNLTVRHSTNPEILKSIAYTFDSFGLKREALELYKKIFYLRPHYAQSHRDVANAYWRYDKFKIAWRIYMNFLLEGHKLNENAIGKMIYNEMEYLFHNRAKQTDIKENFIPLNSDKNKFKKDIRLIYEWNTSEAEFELEFVNPGLRSYIFEHSQLKNSQLITNEKIDGYSSTQYEIEDLDEGDWLVNFTYLGNKQQYPTFLKQTVYYNWGTSHQRTEIDVYTIHNENQKFQLLKLNKDDLKNFK